MRMELKDLQDAFDHRFAFPMYLLRLKFKHQRTVRYWNMSVSEHDLDQTEFALEVLAFVEIKPGGGQR